MSIKPALDTNSLPPGALPKGCSCSQLGNDQLALIGAAFVAGIGVGRGQLSQIGNGSMLPDNIPQTCFHQIPTIPLKLDGRSVAPESVKDFDGKPLYYVLDEAGLAGDVLQVFSTPDKANKFLIRSLIKPKAVANMDQITVGTGSSPQDIANAIYGSVSLFEHINFGGAKWDFAASTSGNDGQPNHPVGDGNIGDFRRVYCFLWWCQNIGGKVSSIQNNTDVYNYVLPQQSFVILHDNVNFGGSQLVVPARGAIENMVPIGWNDRAFSLSYRVV